MIREIIYKTDYNIYCLIRGKNPDERLIKQLNFYFYDGLKYINKRIFIVNGDITKSNLDLANDEYNKLGKNINVIYHAAALVKYYGKLSDFINANINGTINICTFAQKFNIFLNHISTTSVNKYIENGKIKESILDIPYIWSKLEAEKVILNENNLNCRVYRVGNLSARYFDGIFIHNTDNLFYNVLAGMLKSGFVPRFLCHKEMELTPVDYCADAILSLSQIRNISNKSILNVYNHNIITIRELISILNSLNVHIEFINDQFIDLYLKNINNEIITFALKNLVYDFAKIDIKDSTNFYLPNFQWPLIDKTYLKKIIEKYLS